ncbi:MAG: 4-amino-4-deoxy-L-arabinose transferase, partial [Pricia sp.]|nr:4-amino-4-deoxy-L-arabinose transferase [Pricia sp.]
MYEFYAGVPSFSLNNEYYRRNQYSIDQSEKQVQHQKVLYVSQSAKDADLAFPKVDGAEYYGRFINDFESFRKLRVFIENPPDAQTKRDKLLKVYNPYNEPIDLKKLRFNVAFMTDNTKKKERWRIQPKPIDSTISRLPANDTLTLTFRLPKPTMKNPRYIRIGISENGLCYGINGKKIKLE